MKTIFVSIILTISGSVFAQSKEPGLCTKNCLIDGTGIVDLLAYGQEKLLYRFNNSTKTTDISVSQNRDGSLNIKFINQKDADHFLNIDLTGDALLGTMTASGGLVLNHGIQMNRELDLVINQLKAADRTLAGDAAASEISSTSRLFILGEGFALASAFVAGYSVGDALVVIDRKYNNGAIIDKISRIIFYPLEYKQNRKFSEEYSAR